MSTIPVAQPYALKAATFKIGADEYTAAVSQVQFDPSPSSSTWRGIGGNVLTNQSIATWNAVLGFAQDLAPDGLARYLHEHEGETATVEFLPLADGPTITADLIITPGTIGGTAGADYVTASVTMPVQGRPEFTGGTGATSTGGTIPLDDVEY